MRPDPFTLDHLVDSHTSGKFVVINIDHQAIMQTDRTADFKNYNADHAATLKTLRTLNVPIIHTAYDYPELYVALNLTEQQRTHYHNNVKLFHHNKRNMELYTKHKADTQGIRLDILHDVKKGEKFFLKHDRSAFANTDVYGYMMQHEITTIGFVGMYGTKCVMDSMEEVSEKYTLVALVDSIENPTPRPDRATRMHENTKLFGAAFPQAILTDTRKLADRLTA